MKIKKAPDSYDDYKVEMSFKELMALKEAGRNAGDPVADECSRAIEWFFSEGEVPPPGTDGDSDKEPKAKEEPDEADALLAKATSELPVDAPAKVEVSDVEDAEVEGEAEELLPKE